MRCHRTIISVCSEPVLETFNCSPHPFPQGQPQAVPKTERSACDASHHRHVMLGVQKTFIVVSFSRCAGRISNSSVCSMRYRQSYFIVTQRKRDRQMAFRFPCIRLTTATLQVYDRGKVPPHNKKFVYRRMHNFFTGAVTPIAHVQP